MKLNLSQVWEAYKASTFLMKFETEHKDLLENETGQVDLYRYVASKALSIPYEEVTEKQKRQVKDFMFFLVYYVNITTLDNYFVLSLVRIELEKINMQDQEDRRREKADQDMWLEKAKLMQHIHEVEELKKKSEEKSKKEKPDE